MTNIAMAEPTQSVAPPDSRSFARLGRGLWKRVRLQWVRFWHPRATIGTRCDIRRRFDLRMGPSAHVSIGEACVLDNDLVLEVKGRLEIGARTIFGHHCTLAASDSITIGEDCLIAEMVSIRDHDHCFTRLDLPTRVQGEVTGPVRIGRNVWIAGKATITRGVTIGDNAVIGANAVVTKDIPANAVAVGIPARVIRHRTPIEEVLA